MQRYNIQCHKGMEEAIGLMIQQHIESVVHHVVSLAALHAMLEGKHQISLKNVDIVRKYVHSKCGGHIKGGMSMASDFYGYPHPAYATSNANQGIITSEVSWARNEARPALGPAQVGGAKKIDKAMAKLVKDHLQGLGVATGRGVISELQSVIDLHLKCFANDISKESPLTIKKLEKILAKRRHADFQ